MNTNDHMLQNSLVTINKLSQMTGYTAGALRKKIERGILVEGLHYVRGPDNRILVSPQAFNAWILGTIVEPISKVIRGGNHA